jgi:hypothetical protein
MLLHFGQVEVHYIALRLVVLICLVKEMRVPLLPLLLLKQQLSIMNLFLFG